MKIVKEEEFDGLEARWALWRFGIVGWLQVSDGAFGRHHEFVLLLLKDGVVVEVVGFGVDVVDVVFGSLQR